MPAHQLALQCPVPASARLAAATEVPSAASAAQYLATAPKNWLKIASRRVKMGYVRCQ